MIILFTALQLQIPYDIMTLLKQAEQRCLSFWHIGSNRIGLFAQPWSYITIELAILLLH
jgi:hypothetical protein